MPGWGTRRPTADDCRASHPCPSARRGTVIGEGKHLALDHYVSQVHLRQFYAPALGGLMYATKKSDLKSFCCDSKSVCRIEENSTNAYLANDREVEEFLIGVEPKYNASVGKLRDGKIDQECIAVIGGFAAYVSCCA